jgi:transcriptional regulator with XRE-family HTH domain
MDLNFKKPEEVVTLLCERLRKERLYLEMTQADVATRAGISVNTVSNLEAGRNVSFENLVRCHGIGPIKRIRGTLQTSFKQCK